LAVALIATTLSQCAGTIRPTDPAPGTHVASLWEPPDDLSTRDLFYGPWGAEHAPDPAVEYTFVRPKVGGYNPGMVVRDPQGRLWHVKQPSRNAGDEGPSEVVLSRVLSALGYHQPPVYYLSSFMMRDGKRVRRERGGRFRLDHPALTDAGEWSWHQNPFVGQRPYQGLLVILLMFNQSDLKDSNNTVYDYRAAAGVPPRQWYVMRDLGLALGKTGRISPKRNDLDAFASTRFIVGGTGGFVRFDYHGLHQELVRGRITRDDVRWAGALAGRLSDRQWRDAFRAGGYAPDMATRFIEILRRRVSDAQRVDVMATR
jgi:hypothetical protein